MQLIAAAGWVYMAFIVLNFTKRHIEVVHPQVGQGYP
jgi:hypothetical protein